MTNPPPRPGVMEIEPYVAGKSALAGQQRVIKLSSNEGALGPSPRAMAALAAQAQTLHRYPDGGAGDLRAAIARRFGIDAARIVCGAGSDELIALLTKAYAGPGDEVLYSQYGFVMYPISTHAAGATPVMAPETGFRTDVDALLAKAGPRTRICFVANPNNPTGSYISAAELRRLRDGLPAHVLLVIDAAYAEYVSRNDYSAGVELAESRDDVVMLRTFSKIFALGGLRLGWGYAAPGIIDVLNRVRGPFNVSSVAQAVGVAALADLAFTDAARVHNDVWMPWFAARVAELGLEPLPSVGNFVLVRFPAGPRDAAAANAHLARDGIIPRMVGSYGLPDFIRFTIGTEEEMRAVVASLSAFMKG